MKVGLYSYVENYVDMFELGDDGKFMFSIDPGSIFLVIGEEMYIEKSTGKHVQNLIMLANGVVGSTASHWSKRSEFKRVM